MRRILSFTLLLALWAPFAFGDTPTGTVGPMLIVSKTVGLPETGFQITKKAEIGTPALRGDDAGYTLSGKTTSIEAPAGISVSMHYSYDPASPPLGSGVLAWASPFFDSAKTDISSAITAYAKTHGLTGGLYTYQQHLYVNGQPIPLTLFWQVIAWADGRSLAQMPRLIATEPSYLQFEYVPVAVAEGLDSGLSYPTAGKLIYRLLDKDLAPLSADSEIDTAGAFDQPSYSGNGPLPAGCIDDAGTVRCDQDWGVRCLIDSTSNTDCPAGYPDMVTLMEDLGATGGFLDYARSLSPVMEEFEDPPGSGTMVYVPQVSIVIDSRSISGGKTFFFISPGGGMTYIETGTVGWQLLNQTDRFRVQPDGTYELALQARTTETSPNTAFTKTITITGTCANYQPDIIIDPFDTDLTYDWRNDTVNGLPSNRYTSVANLICE